LQPKRIHKIILKNTVNTILDSIKDRQGNILTNPEDIAEEIYIQQSILNQPFTSTCHHQPNHNPKYVCGVKQYPWHDLNGFILEKRGDTNASLTILLYKKSDPTIITNHIPIALANTIYKLFTSTITAQLANCGEKYQLLQNSQEGFRQERCTLRQLQTLIAAFKDSRFTQQDIYLLYIDFKNAFGSIDHARLLAIMADLGYPQDVINLIGNIYSNSSTIFTRTYFGKTKPVHIQRRTI
jgi:hypothetical protein